MVHRAEQPGHAHVQQLGMHGSGCAAQDEEVPYCGAGDALVQCCASARCSLTSGKGVVLVTIMLPPLQIYLISTLRQQQTLWVMMYMDVLLPLI